MTFRIEISQFHEKVNPKNGNETKSDSFPWDVFKSNSNFFFNEKISKYVQDFQNQIKTSQLYD